MRPMAYAEGAVGQVEIPFLIEAINFVGSEKYNTKMQKQRKITARIQKNYIEMFECTADKADLDRMFAPNTIVII